MLVSFMMFILTLPPVRVIFILLLGLRGYGLINLSSPLLENGTTNIAVSVFAGMMSEYKSCSQTR